jgi:hypothetical protein
MQNGIFVFFANIAIGVPSVFALYVADSALTREYLSAFIKVWALTNTLIVGVTSPLITYAPNLRMDFKNDTAQFDQYFFSISFITSLIIIIPTEIVAVCWLFGITDFTVLSSLALFIIFSISFNVKNALLIAKGAYGKYLLGASVYGIAASLALLFFLYIEFQSISTLFYIFSFALGVASIDRFFAFVVDFSTLGFPAFVSRIVKMKTFTPFLITVFITSCSTFILNGPLLFGSLIGSSNSQLVTFGTCLNIGLICYTILNSFTSPIQTSLISSLNQSENGRFGLIYRKSFNNYLLFTLFLTIFLSATLNFFAQIYVPSVLHLNFMTRLILVAGLGFSTLAGLPRLGLMFSKRYTQLFFIWCGGLFLFFLVVFLPVEPFTAMVLAPTIASFFILIACTASLGKLEGIVLG